MAKLIYSEQFYRYQSIPSKKSAEVIVPILIEYFQPKKVIDVGCGIGTWLKVFSDNGVLEIKGMDGIYINPKLLLIDEMDFSPIDLSQIPKINIESDFDIALCLEVAEHIPENSAGNLIKLLTSLAPVIYFSAAIPGQGGANHVNEKWPDYWHDLFNRYGYDNFDIIRPVIWSSPQVEPWYSQNSFIYIKRSKLTNYIFLRKRMINEMPIRVVHPLLFQRFVTLEYISTKRIISELFHRISRKLFSVVGN